MCEDETLSTKRSFWGIFDCRLLKLRIDTAAEDEAVIRLRSRMQEAQQIPQRWSQDVSFPCPVHSTLRSTNMAMENPPFGWYVPGKIGIF